MKKLLSLAILASALSLGGLTSCNTDDQTQTTLANQESLRLQSLGAFNMVEAMQSTTTKSKILRKDDVLTNDTKERIKEILPNLELMLDNGVQEIQTKIEKVNISHNTEVYNVKETYVYEDQTYVLLYHVDDSSTSGTPVTSTDQPVTSTDQPVTSTEEPVISTETPVTSTEQPTSSTTEEENSSFQETPQVNQKNNYRDRDDDDDDDDDEIKIVDRVTGLAFIGGIPTSHEGELLLDEGMKFTSHVEEKIERDETETERKLTMYTGVDSYIQVDEEHEVEGNEEEHEIQYTVVENKVKTLEYSIKFESDEKDTVEYELNQEEFEVKRVIRNEETYFIVDYENDTTDEEGLVTFLKQITMQDDHTVVTYIEVTRQLKS